MKKFKQKITEILSDYSNQENWREFTDEEIIKQLVALFLSEQERLLKNVKKDLLEIAEKWEYEDLRREVTRYFETE
ncbi:MAG: hypothetical protein AAB922_01660 [Patescibacteria group bacterium]